VSNEHNLDDFEHEWHLTDLEDKRNKVFAEVEDELNETGSFRSEALLITNYVEFVLKDIMEFLLKSKKARNVARDTVKEILKDRKIITEDQSKDIKKIFTIRDLFGHNLLINEIKTEVEKLIETMNVISVLHEANSDWNELNVDSKLSKIGVKMFNDLDWILRGMIFKECNPHLKSPFDHEPPMI